MGRDTWQARENVGRGKKGRKKMLEGRDRKKWDLFTDLEVISRQVAIEVDEMALDGHVALRPQDKVLGETMFSRARGGGQGSSVGVHRLVEGKQGALWRGCRRRQRGAMAAASAAVKTG